MAHIHVLDNGYTANNGVMAMALGFKEGITSTFGCDHSLTVVLNDAATFRSDAERFAKYGLPSTPNGLARWRGGLNTLGAVCSLLVPITARIWRLGQTLNLPSLHLGHWVPADADLAVSLCGEDFFSDNWSLRQCHQIDIQYSYIERLGIPHVILAQTLGPFRRSFSRALAVKHLSRATLITARDQSSYKTVTEDLGIRQNVHRTGDLAFLMQADDIVAVAQRHSELRPFLSSADHWLGVSVSHLFGRSTFTSLRSPKDQLECFFHTMSLVLDSILSRHRDLRIVLTPHVTSSRGDDRVAGRELLRRLKHAKRVLALEDAYDAPELKAVIGKCDVFVGCRMHALVAAISQGVPALCLAYSPKTVDVIGNGFQYPYVSDLRQADPKSAARILSDSFEGLWHSRNAIRRQLQAALPAATALSMKNFSLLALALKTTREGVGSLNMM